MIKNSHIIYTTRVASGLSSGAIGPSYRTNFSGISSGAIVIAPNSGSYPSINFCSGSGIGKPQENNLGVLRLITLESIEVYEPKILTPDNKIEDTLQDPNLGEVYLKASASYKELQSRIYFLINNEKYHTMPQYLFNDYNIEVLKIVFSDEDLEWVKLAYEGRKKQLATNMVL